MRDKGNRNRRTGQARHRKSPVRPVREHPLYGNIPLIRGEGATTTSSWECDPGFQPRMPAGAVRGDVSRQRYCPHCHVPKYFFVDQEHTCLQCGRDFVFSAKEQKYWYETLQFNFNSVAVRCIDCRRKRRSEKALRQQIAVIRSQLEEGPRDPSRLLELAESIVRYHHLSGQGDLDTAIAASRQALREWGDAVAGLYWEAHAHIAAGRQAKGIALLAEFVARAPPDRAHAALVRDAKSLLESCDAV